jgi:hypothetical protein
LFFARDPPIRHPRGGQNGTPAPSFPGAFGECAAHGFALMENLYPNLYGPFFWWPRARRTAHVIVGTRRRLALVIAKLRSFNLFKMEILMGRKGPLSPLEVWACIPTFEQVHGGRYDPATVSEIIKRLTSPRRVAKTYEPIELSLFERVQRVVTHLYRQPTDPTEMDVDAALKVLVAQERATFVNLSTNKGIKSGWVRLMKEGDV